MKVALEEVEVERPGVFRGRRPVLVAGLKAKEVFGDGRDEEEVVDLREREPMAKAEVLDEGKRRSQRGTRRAEWKARDEPRRELRSSRPRLLESSGEMEIADLGRSPV